MLKKSLKKFVCFLFEKQNQQNSYDVQVDDVQRMLLGAVERKQKQNMNEVS